MKIEYSVRTHFGNDTVMIYVDPKPKFSFELYNIIISKPGLIMSFFNSYEKQVQKAIKKITVKANYLNNL